MSVDVAPSVSIPIDSATTVVVTHFTSEAQSAVNLVIQTTGKEDAVASLSPLGALLLARVLSVAGG